MFEKREPLWMNWTEVKDGDRVGGRGVYAIANMVTGCVLVSASNDLAKRLWDSRRCLASGRHWNPRLNTDLATHGKSSFRFYLVTFTDSAAHRKIVKFFEQHRAAGAARSYNTKPVYRRRVRSAPSVSD